MTSAGDKDDEAPPAPVMVPTTPEEAARLARVLDGAPSAADGAPSAADGAPSAAAVTPDRMRELKDKARAEIEQRLKERRKKRRLLRGGDLP